MNDDLTLRQLLGIPDRPWLADALCGRTDPALFFPAKGGSSAAAKRVCRACPALASCAEWAIPQTDLHGVAGGMSERERKAERARRRAAA